MKFVRKLFAGFIVGLGLAMGIATIGAVKAATIPTATAFPSPANPSAMLYYLNQIIADLNSAISYINQNIAVSGTGQLNAFLAISGTQGQFVGATTWTTTTSVCAVTGALLNTQTSECLGFYDPSGVFRWLAAK